MFTAIVNTRDNVERESYESQRIIPTENGKYNVEDLAGHVWTFTQSIADADPREWGGEPGQL